MAIKAQCEEGTATTVSELEALKGELAELPKQDIMIDIQRYTMEYYAKKDFLKAVEPVRIQHKANDAFKKMNFCIQMEERFVRELKDLKKKIIESKAEAVKQDIDPNQELLWERKTEPTGTSEEETESSGEEESESEEEDEEEE